MTADDHKLPPALVQVKDVLGLSEPGKRLVDAIAHGIGRWVYPWERRRNASADIAIFREAARALREEGFAIEGATLSLEERAAVRFTAQELHRQENREAIAARAVSEFLDAPNSFAGSDEPLDLDWLDRFWRLAEDVSNADFQSIWARVLARQAAGGSTYSVRCLQTLSMLNRAEAETLERLAAMAIQTTFWERSQVPCVINRGFQYFYGAGGGAPSGLAELSKELQDIVGSLEADLLGPSGIYVESGWAHDAFQDVSKGEATIRIAGVPYKIGGFADPLPKSAVDGRSAVHLGAGMRFSPVGAEIVGLIKTTPNPHFVRVFREILKLFDLVLDQV